MKKKHLKKMTASDVIEASNDALRKGTDIVDI